MAADFKEARLKIGRAEKHIGETKRLIREFTARKTHEVTSNFKDGNTEFSFKSPEPVPDDINLAVGDAIHNLRASFDYAIFAIVSRFNPGVDPRRVQLPIHANRLNTEGAMKDAKTPIGIAFTSQIGEELRSVILDEIYRGAGDSPFLLLHGLDNIDKHRLVVTLSKLGGGVFNVTNEYGGGIQDIAVVAENHANLVRLAGKVTGNVKPTIDVLFSEIEFPGYKPVIPTLDDFTNICSELIKAVERCVIAHGGLP